MLLRPKGLKVYSYVEKYAEFKNQSLKKIGWYTKLLCATEYPWVEKLQNKSKNGDTLVFYTLKMKFLKENARICIKQCKIIYVQ